MTAVVEDFQKIVRAAGFGQRTRHSVNIGFTEAEAAAVYTANNAASQKAADYPDEDLTVTPKSTTRRAGIRGHTLLLCDSGEGTMVVSQPRQVGPTDVVV